MEICTSLSNFTKGDEGESEERQSERGKRNGYKREHQADEIPLHARGEMLLFTLVSSFKCEMSSSVVLFFLALPLSSCSPPSPALTLPSLSSPCKPLMEERAFTIHLIHVTLLHIYLLYLSWDRVVERGYS